MYERAMPAMKRDIAGMTRSYEKISIHLRTLHHEQHTFSHAVIYQW